MAPDHQELQNEADQRNNQLRMKVPHICSASTHVILIFSWPQMAWVQTAMDGDDEYGYDDEFTEEDLHILDEIELAACGGVFQ